MSTKSPQHNGARREELLAIAEEISSEVGPEAVKLREIARRAGIAAPSIYNHFDSFEDLLTQLVGQLLDKLADTYDEGIDLPPNEALRSICYSQVNVMCQHPGAARILLADFALPGGHGAVERSKAKLNNLNELDADLTKRGLDSGVFRNVDAHEFTLARLGMILIRLAAKWMTTPTLSTRERDQVSKMIFDYSSRIVSRG